MYELGSSSSIANLILMDCKIYTGNLCHLTSVSNLQIRQLKYSPVIIFWLLTLIKSFTNRTYVYMDISYLITSIMSVSIKSEV